MVIHPLFANDDQTDESDKDDGFVLHRQHKRRIEPLPGHGARLQEESAIKPPAAKDVTEPSAPHKTAPSEANPAIELIRQKVNALYAKEPSVEAEAAATPQPRPRSKHEQFMYELSTSGKSLADIQTAWHNYYVGLPEHEKHEVWQEFYTNNARRQSAYVQFTAQREAANEPAAGTPPPEMPTQMEHVQTPALVVVGSDETLAPKLQAVNPSAPIAKKHDVPGAKAKKRRAAKTVKRQILAKARLSEQAQIKARRHLQSLVFGLSTGAVVLVIFLFGFFNEVIIAPFIQPSRHITSTPIILTSSDISASSTPEVIIPKINVEIPVNYSLTTDDENTIENALEGGVVHYPSTVLPGQQGNAAFFGHSSNNIFNPGQYKFAFVLLHTLVPGDLFYITYNGTVYTYRVYDKKIVDPSEVDVLDSVPGKTATATLITCDPPGTSLHRLVVWGEQISPDPSGNSTSNNTLTATAPPQLASNGPTLWSRFIHWLF